MSKEDFENFRQVSRPRLKEGREIVGDIDGIHLEGLIIVRDTFSNSIFPLLFHEIGHSLYPNTHDNYIDELRAMYFQILCVKLFESELRKVGINAGYKDNYYENQDMPTVDHKRAFDYANVLYTYQSLYDKIVLENPVAEKN